MIYKFAICEYVFCSIYQIKHHTINFANNLNHYNTPLRRPKLNSKDGERSLMFAGPTMYNSLPRDLKISTSHYLFRRSSQIHFNFHILNSKLNVHFVLILY